jgi:hypothetical protein
MTGARPLIVLLTTIAAATGCRATYLVRSPLVADSRELVVRFQSPRELEVPTTGRPLQRLSDVQMLRGRAISVRNDTLELRVEHMLQIPRLQQPTTWRPVSPPLIVALPLGDQSIRIEEQRLSPGRTMAAVVLTAPAVAFALAIMLQSGNR